MAIFDVPQRFSQKWVHDKVPTMDSTEMPGVAFMLLGERLAVRLVAAK